MTRDDGHYKLKARVVWPRKIKGSVELRLEWVWLEMRKFGWA